jgi:hypothetical protein
MSLRILRHPDRPLWALSVLLASVALVGAGGPDQLPPVLDFANESGVARTYSAA